MHRSSVLVACSGKVALQPSVYISPSLLLLDDYSHSRILLVDTLSRVGLKVRLKTSVSDHQQDISSNSMDVL